MILAYFAIGVVTTLVLGAVVRAVRSDYRRNAQLHAPQPVLILERRVQQPPTRVDVEVMDLPKTLGR